MPPTIPTSVTNATGEAAVASTTAVDNDGNPDYSPASGPRIIVYHQTHYHNDRFISMLPLVAERSGVTHIVVAAIHLNEQPGNITLNDDAWESPRAARVWAEVARVRATSSSSGSGGTPVRVLGLLGGAARGTFARLDGPAALFEAFYAPLRRLLTATGLDGLDVDVEEPMSLAGVVRLVDRLRADFGPGFTVTLAPVAAALVAPHRNLSGFSYFELEKALGRHVAWYNAQFYCNWGSAATTEHYDQIMACGWPPHKVVLGLVTNPANGAGWVDEDMLMAVIAVLRDEYPGFAGVMGWEYFNAVSSMDDDVGVVAAAAEAGGATGKPWLWAKGMSSLLGRDEWSEVMPTQEEKSATENPFLQIINNEGR